MIKICSKCEAEKDRSEFYHNMGVCKVCHAIRTNEWKKNNPAKAKTTALKSYYKNKEARDKTSRQWQLANPEKVKRIAIKWELKTKYGITLEKYESMVEAQNGLCAVCNTKPSHRRLDVDHSHISGKLRKLLCSNCNTALGLLKEDKERITKLLQYLEEHSN